MKNWVILFVILIVAFFALCIIGSTTTGFSSRSLPSWTGPLELRGALSDLNGRPMETKTGVYWKLPQKSVRVIPDYFSDIVAINKDGHVFGSAIHDQLRYSLILYDDWYTQDVLYIKIGYYNADHPYQSKLYDCTTVDVDDIRNSQSSRKTHSFFDDLNCNITVSRR